MWPPTWVGVLAKGNYALPLPASSSLNSALPSPCLQPYSHSTPPNPASASTLTSPEPSPASASPCLPGPSPALLPSCLLELSWPLSVPERQPGESLVLWHRRHPGGLPQQPAHGAALRPHKLRPCGHPCSQVSLGQLAPHPGSIAGGRNGASCATCSPGGPGRCHGPYQNV